MSVSPSAVQVIDYNDLPKFYCKEFVIGLSRGVRVETSSTGSSAIKSLNPLYQSTTLRDPVLNVPQASTDVPDPIQTTDLSLIYVKEINLTNISSRVGLVDKPVRPLPTNDVSPDNVVPLADSYRDVNTDSIYVKYAGNDTIKNIGNGTTTTDIGNLHYYSNYKPLAITTTSLASVPALNIPVIYKTNVTFIHKELIEIPSIHINLIHKEFINDLPRMINHKVIERTRQYTTVRFTVSDFNNCNLLKFQVAIMGRIQNSTIPMLKYAGCYSTSINSKSTFGSKYAVYNTSLGTLSNAIITNNRLDLLDAATYGANIFKCNTFAITKRTDNTSYNINFVNIPDDILQYILKNDSCGTPDAKGLYTPTSTSFASVYKLVLE